MTTTELDLDAAVATIADQFRAVKARNVRWNLTSIPLVDIEEQFNVSRDDAFALRSLAFELVTPRLVDLVGEQRLARGADRSPRALRGGCVERLDIVQSAWLANPHIAVSEVARLVSVHPSTARSYLQHLRAASQLTKRAGANAAH